MATPYPAFDPFDPAIQKIRDDAEVSAYGHQGGIALDAEILKLFFQAHDRPRVSVLLNDVLSRPDVWGLGSTMVDVGDRLGTDHTAISRALHWGEFSPSLERYLLHHPRMPNDLWSKFAAVADAQDRCALICVMDYLGTRVQREEWPRRGVLTELHYELLCELLRDRAIWENAKDTDDAGYALQLTNRVCGDGNRQVLPFWHTSKRRRQVQMVIKRLIEDADFSFHYLSLLQRRWEPCLVLARSATEMTAWAES